MPSQASLTLNLEKRLSGGVYEANEQQGLISIHCLISHLLSGFACVRSRIREYLYIYIICALSCALFLALVLGHFNRRSFVLSYGAWG